MKLNITKVFLILTVGLGTLITYQSHAGLVKTNKGYRLDDTKWERIPLKDLEDFKSLKKGDKIAMYCPARNRMLVVTVRDADSKGRVKIKETRRGWDVGGCHVVLQRTPGQRETRQMIVCPICPKGTLHPMVAERLTPINS